MADSLARPLLAIVDDILAAIDRTDPDTGEVPADAAAQLDALELPLATKAMAYHLAGARLRADEDACREMAAKLTRRAQARARDRQQLDDRMKLALLKLGQSIKAPTVTAYLQSSTSVEIIGDVPDKFCTVKVERVPDKRAIKAALEAGQQLPFATLVTSNSVRYR